MKLCKYYMIQTETMCQIILEVVMFLELLVWRKLKTSVQELLNIMMDLLGKL